MAAKYGDAIGWSKTNTYDIKNFSNATNQTRLHHEVGKARQTLIDDAAEEKLMKQRGYSPRQAIVASFEAEHGRKWDIPEELVEFRAHILKKKKIHVVSVKQYKFASTKKPAADKAREPQATVFEHIRACIDIAEWQRHIEVYTRAHTVNPKGGADIPGCTGDEDEEDWLPRRDETEAQARKREGVLRWAKTMIGLNDIEVFNLTEGNPSRRDSTSAESDPKANVKAKQAEINKDKQERAEQVAEEANKRAAKKASPPPCAPLLTLPSPHPSHPARTGEGRGGVITPQGEGEGRACSTGAIPVRHAVQR